MWQMSKKRFSDDQETSDITPDMHEYEDMQHLPSGADWVLFVDETKTSWSSDGRRKVYRLQEELHRAVCVEVIDRFGGWLVVYCLTLRSGFFALIWIRHHFR